MRLSNILKSAAKTLVVFSLAALPTWSQGMTVFDFPLNEGSGEITMDTVTSWKGYFGTALDPATDYVTLSSDSPSGAPGDGSAVTHGKGFLVAEDTTGALNLTNGPITVEVWVKVDDTSPQKSNEGMVGFGSSYKLGTKQGAVVFTLFGKVDITNTAAPYLLSGWNHYAAAWEPGVGVTFYVNGSPTFIANTNTTARAALNNFLTIGGEAVNNTFNLLASFDRARIHHAVLSADQIDSDPANPKPPFSSTIVAYNFNETSLPATNSVGPAMPTQSNVEVKNLFFPGPEWSNDSATAGINNHSVFFDYSGKALIAPDPAKLVTASGFNGGYTLEAWVRLPATFVQTNRMVIMAYLSPDLGVTFSIDKNRSLHTTFLGKKNVTSTAFVPNDGNWHHVAAVWEQGKEVRFYVDSVLGATSAYVDVIGARAGDPQLMLGSEGSVNTRFTGWIDRVRFSNEPLTPAQFMYQTVPNFGTIFLNQGLHSGQSVSTNFTIGNFDALNSSAVTLTASTDNPELFPTGSITFGGSGTNRTMTLSPAAGKAGRALVTVRVSDGVLGAYGNTFAVTVGAPEVIALWDFNSLVRDYTTSSGSLSSIIGNGVASAVNVGSSTLSSGMTPASDTEPTDNSQWRLGTFPAASTGNKTAGAEFHFSTAGYQNIHYTWEHWNSATGSKYWRVQYALDGVNFQDHTVYTAPDSTTTFQGAADFSSIQGANNNPNFAVRFVAEFAGTATGQAIEGDNYIGARANPPATYGTAGTLWLDMVQFTGEPYSPTAAVSLKVGSNASGGVEISWDAAASGTLENTASLTNPDWQAVSESVSTVEGRKVVTVANPTGAKFYRLHVQ